MVDSIMLVPEESQSQMSLSSDDSELENCSKRFKGSLPSKYLRASSYPGSVQCKDEFAKNLPTKHSLSGESCNRSPFEQIKTDIAPWEHYEAKAEITLPIHAPARSLGATLWQKSDNE